MQAGRTLLRNGQLPLYRHLFSRDEAFSPRAELISMAAPSCWKERPLFYFITIYCDVIVQHVVHGFGRGLTGTSQGSFILSAHQKPAEADSQKNSADYDRVNQMRLQSARAFFQFDTPRYFDAHAVPVQSAPDFVHSSGRQTMSFYIVGTGFPNHTPGKFRRKMLR